eukprot:TRINITY_DN12661_c0_g5_i1.p1 TRINITY_DN12661_c0_g5~~TRINITY_DN12661_c0_g5_i1.p1  ORF type:complete len:678 (-),score=85.24 TRINITY_DN12661_c0_g5_i1:361-2394(-)
MLAPCQYDERLVDQFPQVAACAGRQSAGSLIGETGHHESFPAKLRGLARAYSVSSTTPGTTGQLSNNEASLSSHCSGAFGDQRDSFVESLDGMLRTHLRQQFGPVTRISDSLPESAWHQTSWTPARVPLAESPARGAAHVPPATSEAYLETAGNSCGSTCGGSASDDYAGSREGFAERLRRVTQQRIEHYLGNEALNGAVARSIAWEPVSVQFESIVQDHVACFRDARGSYGELAKSDGSTRDGPSPSQMSSRDLGNADARRSPCGDAAVIGSSFSSRPTSADPMRLASVAPPQLASALHVRPPAARAPETSASRDDFCLRLDALAGDCIQGRLRHVLHHNVQDRSAVCLDDLHQAQFCDRTSRANGVGASIRSAERAADPRPLAPYADATAAVAKSGGTACATLCGADGLAVDAPTSSIESTGTTMRSPSCGQPVQALIEPRGASISQHGERGLSYEWICSRPAQRTRRDGIDGLHKVLSQRLDGFTRAYIEQYMISAEEVINRADEVSHGSSGTVSLADEEQSQDGLLEHELAAGVRINYFESMHSAKCHHEGFKHTSELPSGIAPLALGQPNGHQDCFAAKLDSTVKWDAERCRYVSIEASGCPHPPLPRGEFSPLAPAHSSLAPALPQMQRPLDCQPPWATRRFAAAASQCGAGDQGALIGAARLPQQPQRCL